MKTLFLAVLMLFVATASWAIESVEFDTVEQTDQYSRLIAELRCLVCQNQNLADSNAELAKDLKQEVAKMVRQGNSDSDVIDFMVLRYGNFVLYRPPLNLQTILLWLGPFLLLLLGSVIIIRFIRNRPSTATQINSEQRDMARKLLNDDES